MPVRKPLLGQLRVIEIGTEKLIADGTKSQR